MLDRAQQRRLRRVVEAARHVPYYRETCGRLGLALGSVTTAKDLAKLPILEREQVQRDPEYFVSDACSADDLLKLETGGSSGRPLAVSYEQSALFEASAHHRRSMQVVASIRRQRGRARLAVIRATDGVSRTAGHAPLARNPLPRILRPVTLQLSMMDSPAHNAAKIAEFEPTLIGSYGSYLAALFVHVRESGARLALPEAVIYGGDALPDPVRRMLSDEMGIEVLSLYGAVEAPHIGFECEQHTGLHLNEDIYPLRLVDADGRDVPEGEGGQVVVSNLVNRAMVLLNYRLGDHATALGRGCPCGRTLPLLSLPEGRIDDWLETPMGERKHPQAVRTLFTDEQEVWSYRVVQRSPGDLLAQVVAADGCDRAGLEVRLRRKFTDRLGGGVRLEVEYVKDLPRTQRGKVRTVVAR